MTTKQNLPFTFQDLTPTLWRESIIRIFKEIVLKNTTLGWSLIRLENYLPRQLPDAEIFIDRIGKAGWARTAYECLTTTKHFGTNKVALLDKQAELTLINLLVYYINNCSVHELIHLQGEIRDEPLVYYLTQKLLDMNHPDFLIIKRRT